jgi:hypothetical protein
MPRLLADKNISQWAIALQDSGTSELASGIKAAERGAEGFLGPSAAVERKR